ncbi:DUF4159 domain-containing protein [Kiritimatiella glycovorans]|uniref:DUF4159 domain-containing protein n=1 Tax=Kiritimatiella glycovorans TaxID=1307763 RepID=A0A0G3EF35_9BACT|nr:DUF4159 domain-containing protein [Kiritimatiella glycovorans]AKJ63380.1 hypothetical protein L21SP4_00094 [Kiritimatiella glycovorans]
MKTLGRILFPLFAAVCVCGAAQDEDAWLKPLGQPPKAAPRRISGGESLPPLPLPATPLRRTERKRQPSPPTLVTKVMWGETASFQFEDGKSMEVADWNQCPSDVQSILHKARGPLQVRYGYETAPIAAFHGDPARTPLLLFSGSRSIRFDEDQLRKLRAYVLRGGMIVADNIAGSPFFYQSFREAMLKAFPELAVREIPDDHPVYHMLAEVRHVHYPRNRESNEPYLEGMYVGSRIGVLISRYGLGCGWDNHHVPFIDEAVFYDVPSASQIGINLIAYAVGYAETARREAEPEWFGSLDEQDPTDQFVFAQLRHEGAWNVHPGGAAALLRRLERDTSMRVSLKRVAVDPGKDDLSGYTFLYLTGLDDFRWSDTEAARLRGFLNSSGTLLINNGLGLSTFDRAVRRELQKVLPGAELVEIPAGHPVYHAVFPVRSVRYTPAATPDREAAPKLYGVRLHGDLRVIYSPYDIEAGWQGGDHPLAKALEPQSAMQLGVNIAMYAMTH